VPGLPPASAPPPDPSDLHPSALPAWVTAGAALGLFLIWSNSFVAIGYLLGSEGAPARFDWLGLTAGRFLPAAVLAGGYCLLFRRRESAALVRAEWRRLLPAAAVAVPAYNLALYYGQQAGVPAPVASLTTALLPLFVMVLAALFLGERLTRPRVIGFAVAACGMTVIALARRGEVGAAYPLLVLVTAGAPASWAVFSVLSKPLAGRVSPLLWTYLVIALGGVMVLPLLPLGGWAALSTLDGPGWLALGYLVFPCTVFGFALWTWLLRRLPATSVGFTVFLNPPLTALSKLALAALFPATFVFAVETQEWVGGLVALAGLAIAVWRPTRAGLATQRLAPERSTR
jgi:drug/metabolite transporter (DMT)-like permease